MKEKILKKLLGLTKGGGFFAVILKAVFDLVWDVVLKGYLKELEFKREYEKYKTTTKKNWQSVSQANSNADVLNAIKQLPNYKKRLEEEVQDQG